MATYKAVANGNWSSLAIWQDNSTGPFIASTVLPSAVDTVYMNNFTVAVDINFTIDRLLATAASGITQGGALNITTNRTLTISTDIRQSPGVGAQLITISGTGLTVTITTLDLFYSAGSSIELSATNSTLTFNGNIQPLTNAAGYGINVTGAGNTINVNGNQFTLFSSVGNSAIRIAAINNTLNIVGNQSAAGTGPVVVISQTSNLNITGNQIGITTSAVSLTAGTHIVNIIGNQYGSNSNSAGRGITGIATSNIYITGNCYAGTSSPAIANGKIFYTGGIYNNNDRNAIYTESLTIANLVSTFWQVKDNTSATMVILANTASIPAVGDVRQGVVYTAGNTGTLIVPSPSNVRKGVPTDNTVGTADLSAADMWDYLTSSITTAGSIGKLVKDNLDVAVSTRLASASYVAPDNADIAAIKAVTDTLTDVATETTSLLIKTRTDLIPNNPASVDAVGAIVASYNV